MKYFDLNEYLKKLEDIVNIDSGSRVPEGTSKVADYFEALYSELGLSVTRHRFSEAVGPCLEIHNSPTEDHIDLLLVGHMDTVFPAGTVAERPFRREGDYAYGPGSVDMKCGLVSIYYLMKELLALGTNLNICIAMNSDEEISSNYSKEWLKSLARRSDYAFVMEPGRKNGEYVSERKGLAKYDVQVTGIAAHAGVAPQNGASAIHELSHLVQEIIKLTNYEVGTSVNVGTISGGSAANVVSDHAECLIDTRFDDINEHNKIEAAVKELAAHPTDSRTQITYTIAGFRPPMNMSERSKQLIERMNKHGEALGMTMKWVKTGGVSDANFIAFEGCAAVDGVGPAGEGVHSANEILQVNTIEPRLKVLLETIKEIECEKEGR